MAGARSSRQRWTIVSGSAAGAAGLGASRLCATLVFGLHGERVPARSRSDDRSAAFRQCQTVELRRSF